VAPLLLLVLGLGWTVFAASNSNNTGAGWVSVTRITMYLGAFFLIVLPISLAAIGWASRKMRFALPPGALLRGIGCFALPFAIAIALWLGNESVGGLIFGAVLGGIVACIAVWFLYRLQPLEMGTTLGAVMGGFIGSTLLAYLVFVGVNMVFAGVAKSQGGSSISSSPVGPSLAWNIPRPEEKPRKIIPKGTQPSEGSPTTLPDTSPLIAPGPVTKPVENANTNPNPAPTTNQVATTTKPITTKPVEVVTPQPEPDPNPQPPIKTPTPLTATSPLIAQLTPIEAGDFTEVFFPAMPSNFAAIRRPGETDTVEIWSLNPPAKKFEPIVNAEKGPEAKMIISPAGDLIARVTTWPKMAVQVQSLAAGKALRTIELNPLNGTPELIGFGVNDSVVIHWHKQAAHGIEVFGTKGPATAGPPRIAQFNIDAYEATPGNPSISPDGKLLAIAAVNQGKGGIDFYDLTMTRKGPLRTYFPPLAAWVKPSGMAFAPDGKSIAAFFENEGRGLLVHARILDAKAIHEHIFPIIPVPATTKEKWGLGRSLDFMPEAQEWLLYGQVLIDVETGAAVGALDLPDPHNQRVIDKETVVIQATVDEKPRLATVKLKTDAIVAKRNEVRKK
jgi:hypothetical protein